MVLRITKDGMVGNSRPCYNCLNMMKDIGIHKIYYTTGILNEIICERVKDMISIQSSSVTKRIDTKNTKFNKEEYYYDLLKKFIPNKIKYNNLKYFIDYNFKNIFPNYKIIINENYIYIYNENNNVILQAIIIY
jgi:hypothetical protein